VIVATATAPIPADPPIGGPLWSYVVPAVLFGIAFVATWLLYRRFSRDGQGGA
jgi:hypothetical protein